MESEISARAKAIAKELRDINADAILLTDNANLYYTSGRVFCGYTYITADGQVTYFARRPVGLGGDNVSYVRKPEQIAQMLPNPPATIALELDVAPYSEIGRLSNVFAGATVVNGSPVMRRCRAVKSEYEIAKLRQCGLRHDAAYSQIPSKYAEEMTDIELQIEMERVLRHEGCLGLFRISGGSMELFMGNVICGDNADAPAPYDFAMGGAGLDPSLPVGGNGSVIKPGNTLMVDMCGNFNGYMTDMTRTFYRPPLDPLALRAHNLSIEMHRRFQATARAGVKAKDLYNMAADMADQAGLAHLFMGHAQQAGFIGHGVGIEINELPVIAPRSRDVLQAGNVIALEPKFVIPGVGAVGVENTYVVRADGVERLTNAPEEITEL